MLDNTKGPNFATRIFQALRQPTAWLSLQTVPLLPCMVAHYANKKRIAKHKDLELGDDILYMKIEPGDIKDSLRASLGLRDLFQRRAQGYLTAIAVASSFTIGSIGLLTSENAGLNSLSVASRTIIIIIVLCFIMSAGCALLVLAPSPRYDTWLRSHLPNDPDQKKADMIRFTRLNESYALAYAKHVSGCFCAMRNGALLLLLWLIVITAFPNWVL